MQSSRFARRHGRLTCRFDPNPVLNSKMLSSELSVFRPALLPVSQRTPPDSKWIRCMSSGADPAPMPRCCPAHPDWETLLTHLTEDFSELSSVDVLRELARARQAVRIVTLAPGDALYVAELIARNQLMLTSGRIGDVARLDPEVHRRREESAAS